MTYRGGCLFMACFLAMLVFFAYFAFWWCFVKDVNRAGGAGSSSRMLWYTFSALFAIGLVELQILTLNGVIR